MEIKIKTYGKFVVGKYRNISDTANSVSEEQIMNALNKSKFFNVRDWFGNTSRIKFTIVKIEKDEWGDYIYTVESSLPINKDYCPSILAICETYEDVASPTSYSVL